MNPTTDKFFTRLIVHIIRGRRKVSAFYDCLTDAEQEIVRSATRNNSASIRYMRRSPLGLPQIEVEYPMHKCIPQQHKAKLVCRSCGILIAEPTAVFFGGFCSFECREEAEAELGRRPDIHYR